MPEMGITRLRQNIQERFWMWLEGRRHREQYCNSIFIMEVMHSYGILQMLEMGIIRFIRH